MLGENDSLDHVDHPLHLCEELPDCPVTIRWFSSRPEIMDWEGTYGEMIGEEGEEVILTATAQLQGKEWQESWNVLVFPRVSGEKEQVEDMVEKANADTAGGSEWMQLPAVLHGEKLIWKRAETGCSTERLCLRLCFRQWYFCTDSRKKRNRKRRNGSRCSRIIRRL